MPTLIDTPPVRSFAPVPQLKPRNTQVICVLVVLILGIFLRLPHQAFSGPNNPLGRLHFQPKWLEIGLLGVDEGLYIGYVTDLTHHGLLSYPQIVDHYLELQQKRVGSFLPPTRFLFIFTSWLWGNLFGTSARPSLQAVASCFSMFTFCLAGLIAWRVQSRSAGLAVFTLMAFAPTQIHMSQHVMVDGFFTFWALLCLWSLWENLRAPGDWRWLVVYIGGLALLVLTKENSFFVWVASVTIIVLNRWLRFGTVTRELIIATLLGPLLGVVVLVFLAGGLDSLIAVYRLSVSKNYQVTYAILTGDGPWSRYLFDLFLVSPLIVVLAIGTVFRLDRTKKAEAFMVIFIAASYLVMCNVKYAMNLRYANIWDMPLRLLAFSQICALTSSIKRYGGIVTGLAVAAISAIELRQYYILAVRYPLYELIPHELLRALHILKYQPGFY